MGVQVRGSALEVIVDAGEGEAAVDGRRVRGKAQVRGCGLGERRGGEGYLGIERVQAELDRVFLGGEALQLGEVVELHRADATGEEAGADGAKAVVVEVAGVVRVGQHGYLTVADVEAVEGAPAGASEEEVVAEEGAGPGLAGVDAQGVAVLHDRVVEFVPDESTELELGDRVRVVAPREQMDGVSRFLGDSYKALSEVDLVPFGIGVALGLLLGVVPLPLWGGTSFRLGFAGGPLLVGLVLGKLGRSGPLVWTLPYSAGLTLRQIGVVFFLAGVGTRSGWALVTTVRSGGALPLFLVGLALTVVVTSLLIVLGGRLLRIPSGLLLGMIAGVQTQPADLSFALDQARNEMPTVGYASVYPMATIAKILLAQILLSFPGPG